MGVTYLLIFKTLDAVFFSLDSHGFHGVWPVLHSTLGGLLEGLAVGISLHLIGILIGFSDLRSDSIELIQGDDGSTLVFLVLSCSWGSDSSWVGRGRWLETCLWICASQ